MAGLTTDFEVSIWQLKGIVRSLLASEHAKTTSIALWGPPGIGKTHAMEQVAREIGAQCKVFLTATMDPTDVVGVPHPILGPDVTKFFPPEDFVEICEGAKYDGPMVALFDDMPACQEQVFAALFRMFQQREVAGRKIRDNVLLCATGNRVEDKAGAQDLPTPLANRFVHFNLRVDADEWRTWAIQNDVCEEIVSFVRVNGNMLHRFDPGSGELAFPTPRSVAKASDLCKAIGFDNTGDLRPALIGCCGEGWGTEFLSFLKVRDKLIPPAEIVANPEKARIPKENDIDVIFSTITSLIYHVKKNMKAREAINALIYAPRIPHPEMGIIVARDIVMGIVMHCENDEFRSGVLGAPAFRDMLPKFRKYLKDSN